MKKILALILALIMLGCFAACGEGSGNGADEVSIKFSKETYEVSVGDYEMVSKGIEIKPEGTKVIYEVSDKNIATISKKGEVTGVSEGTVTVTAKTEDGKVSASVTVIVKGFGIISSHNEDKSEGGIKNKRAKAPEKFADDKAILVLISKKIDSSVDKTDIVTLNFGEIQSDGYYANIGDGFYVVKVNNNEGYYKLEDVPTGEYVGLIISSHNYSSWTEIKVYDNSTIMPTLKSSALGDYLSDAELTTLASQSAIQSREFYVAEFEVKANETTTFNTVFAID